MPSKIKYDRQAVVDAAFAMVRQEGLEALNARRIAAALGCSTQPLFRAFSSMEELRGEMIRMAQAAFDRYIRQSPALDPIPYKAAGLAYILFAKEEPQLFRLLFMCDRQGQPSAPDANEAYVLEMLMARYGLTRQQAADFHMQMFIFTHGMAVMIATHFVAYNQEDISRLLTQQFEALAGRCKTMVRPAAP